MVRRREVDDLVRVSLANTANTIAASTGASTRELVYRVGHASAGIRLWRQRGRTRAPPDSAFLKILVPIRPSDSHTRECGTHGVSPDCPDFDVYALFVVY